jgi:hypothetical protein
MLQALTSSIGYISIQKVVRYSTTRYKNRYLPNMCTVYKGENRGKKEKAPSAAYK